MLEYVHKIRPLMRPGDGPLLILFLILVIIAGFAEMLGIGLIIGFVAMISDLSGVRESGRFDIFRDLLGDKPTQDLLVLGAGVILGFTVLKNVFLTGLNFYKFWFVTKRQIDLSKRLFRAYMLGDYELFAQRNSAVILRNVNEETSNLFLGFVDPTLNLVAEVVVVIALLGLMISIEPATTLVTAGILIVCGFAIRQVVTRVSPKFGALALRHLGGMNKWINQGIGGFKEARVLGREKHFVDRHTVHARAYAITQGVQSIMHLLPRFAGEITLMVGFFAITAVLVSQDRPVAEMLTPLALFGAAGMRLMPSFNRIMGNFHQLSFNSASVAEIVADLELFENSIDPTPSGADAEPVRPFSDRIDFENVTSRYRGADRPSLKNVSFTITGGQSVAFVGPTGAGKSTLIDHIVGLLRPMSGIIAIDGRPLDGELKNWHRQIGYIPQSIFLSDDTIRDNVAFGVAVEQIDDDRIWRSLEIAQLGDFVRAQGQGLDCVIGERGIRLSGGQRQRIGIARALYHDPPVLILDEATAALDNQTEADFMAALEQFSGRKTMIFVAHRLSTIRHCDQIHLIDNGEIRASGTYDDLLRNEQAFQSLAIDG